MEIEYNDIDHNAFFIDLRSKEDYDLYHLENSINVSRINLLRNPDKFLCDGTNYILCDRGIVSKSCTNILNALGYNCYSVKGGIESLNK